MRKFLFVLSMSPFLFYCATPKKALDVNQRADIENDLDEICAIEVKRHGDTQFTSSFAHFGNIAMDRYKQSPGVIELILNRFIQTENICRGPYLQLMLEKHGDYLARNWEELDGELTNQERIFLLHYVRQYKIPGFDETILAFLSRNPMMEVRRAAAAALKIIDQTPHVKTLETILAQEQNSGVVKEMLNSLKIEEQPELNELITGLYDHQAEDVHREILTLWATSEREDKRELITRYADHQLKSARDLSSQLLEQLEGKDKLSFVVTNPPKRVKQEPLKQLRTNETLDDELQQLLRRSIWDNDLEMVQAAVERGASFKFNGATHGMPLYSALRGGSLEILKYLTEQGGDLDYIGTGGKTTLMILAQTGYKFVPEKIAFLVEKKIDLNATNYNGDTALIIAASNNRVGAVRALLEAGADHTLRDAAGRTAREMAELLEWEKVVEVFEQWETNN